jgi:hypothetical protein
VEYYGVVGCDEVDEVDGVIKFMSFIALCIWRRRGTAGGLEWKY